MFATLGDGSGWFVLSTSHGQTERIAVAHCLISTIADAFNSSCFTNGFVLYIRALRVSPYDG
jgi:hypothetical protein